jgi:PAS domain S-box-containing protein
LGAQRWIPWASGSQRAEGRGGRSRRWSPDSVATRMLLPAVALAVLLLVVFLAQRGATSTLSDNVLAQARAEQEVSLAYQTEALVLDVETALRGFLLTDDNVFLQPWQTAITAFPSRSSTLVGLEAHSGKVDLGLARRIASGGESYIDIYAAPRLLAFEANRRTGLTLAANLEGKRLVDSLRRDFAQLITRDQRPSVPAEQRAQAAAGWASDYQLAGLVGALILLAGSAVYLRRAVLRPIRRVATIADSMAAGDLSVRVRSASATELARLAQSFNAMAEELEEGQGRLKEQAAELRRSELFLDSVLEHVPSLLSVKDARDLRFVRFNRAGEELAGYSRHELIGKDAYDIVPKAEADVFTAQDRAALAAGVPLDIEEEPLRTRAHGLRYVHTTKIPVLDDLGVPQYLLVISDDITEQRHADRLLRGAKEEAERANAAKSDFLSRMSHELRTPLNSILGFARLLEMDGLSEQQREPVHYILESGRHLLQLINEVLNTRAQAGEVTLFPEPVAAHALLRDVAAIMAPIAAERDIRIEVACGESDWQVRAAPQRLKQVLLNLVSNAIKYNREGGEVRIECERADGKARIAVSDTGRGIAARELSNIFAPFERLEVGGEAIEGAGLGLAISRQLMDAMGGTLTVRSVPGVGSTFTAELAILSEGIRLPAGEGAGGSDPDARSGDAQPHRLLYIEDDVANCKLVERALERRPEIKFEATLQGRLGLDLARHDPPEVIMLDLELPDLDGEQVLVALKHDARTERIPVIVLTADGDPVLAARLLGLGAFAFLTKPLDVGGLLAALDEVLLAGSAVLG